MSPSRATILTGTDEPQPARRTLQAGKLSLVLEGGNLRTICWHGIEAVRGIAYLVRDEDWGTYAPEQAEFEVSETHHFFKATYSGSCTARNGAVLRFQARIEGRSQGELTFEVLTISEADFTTNRTGFNILHPIVGVAGERAAIEHVDGTHEVAVFPKEIDPAQPFRDIRAITHELFPGCIATVRMQGDTFEMEDQRNWSDASYKTYVRPLALPWPYTIPAGKPLIQKVTVRFEGVPQTSAAARSENLTIKLGESTNRKFPLFGLNITPEETAATLASIDALRAIAPRHLILSYDPLQGNDLNAIKAFRRLQQAFDANYTLEITLPCRDDPAAELAAIAKDVATANLRLDAVIVSPAPDLKSTPPGSQWPPCPPLDEIYLAARKAFPGIVLGGGMLSYFTELNRKRVPAEHLDFVTHTTTPLVHAADDLSVMQTLEALPFITGSVRAIFGEKPYRIGPSTIGMRHNPYGSALAKTDGRTRRTMVAEDPRQRGLFAAAWLVAYAAATAPAGLESLTLGALTGPFGAIDQGLRRPAFHAAKALAALSGKPLRTATTSDATRVLALAAGNTLLVANISAEPVTIDLPRMTELRVLDEDTFAEARSGDALPVRAIRDGTLRLGAYGIAVCTLGDPA